ncbi:BAG domain-containing protein [Psidium guajava]|nr:BAG domain-containing protein [Psidium guajava]
MPGVGFTALCSSKLRINQPPATYNPARCSRLTFAGLGSRLEERLTFVLAAFLKWSRREDNAELPRMGQRTEEREREWVSARHHRGEEDILQQWGFFFPAALSPPRGLHAQAIQGGGNSSCRERGGENFQSGLQLSSSSFGPVRKEDSRG